MAWDYYEEIDISLTDFSISFWFKPTVKFDRFMRIIDHGSTSSLIPGNPHVPGFMVRTDKTDKLVIELANKVAPSNFFMDLVTITGLVVGEWT